VWVNILWYLAPLTAVFLKSFDPSQYNNFLIYKQVFYHTLHETNLYDFYKEEYFDKNHYGIIFSLLIAPFTLLPNWLGMVLYQALQLAGLHWMIRKLPFEVKKQNILLLFLLAESIANAQNSQTNTFIAVVMLGAWVWIWQKKEMQAAFITMLGFFVKLYGIVALGLFFFVQRKPRYVLGVLLSAALLFLLPLCITSKQFLFQTYIDWFTELKDKNGTNSDLQNVHQNISALGMYVKIFQLQSFNYLLIILPAFLLQLIPLIRYRLFSNIRFQLNYLAALMLFIILFNTATEASTHIIGATGAGIWWLTQKDYDSKKILLFMLFVFVLGTLSTTDLFPKYVNYEIVRKYSLKAFPYLLVWLICIFQLCFSTFKTESSTHA
jgi:hypothetical protein